MGRGLTQRFGLVHVDYDTLERTPKRSFHWYADVIAAQPGAGPLPDRVRRMSSRRVVYVVGSGRSGPAP